jgi:hypothetical protein
MLIYQQYTDIFAVVREVLERLFDRGGFGLGVHDEEVSLGVRGVGYMLHGFRRAGVSRCALALGLGVLFGNLGIIGF